VLSETPYHLNPPNGWLQNTNNWPYSAAGPYSHKPSAFPRYMDTFGENPRGIHAQMVLGQRKDFTLGSLRDAAYDSYQPAFAQLVPHLLAAWDKAPASHRLKRRLEAPVAALRGWDYRWGVNSVPNSLAVFWAEAMLAALPPELRAQRTRLADHMERHLTAEQKLAAFGEAVERLERDFGRWEVPWGEINRFQRVTGAIVQPFSDAQPSIAVGFPSALWGSLASFGARPYPGTKRWYGNVGNSFVAVVEFGDKVRARAVSAGGESGDPRSPHFNDQAQLYADGNLREVYFYPEQLKGKTERVYRPGVTSR
jgi:acyl-homoserine-lactone acylase